MIDPDKASPLHTKIAMIMGEMDGIPKTGYNKFHGYNYTQEEDVLNKLRPLLAAHGIAHYTNIDDVIFMPNISQTKAGAAEHHTIVKGHILLVDSTSSEAIKINIAGQGIDGQDKGLPKAITMAEKYGLMKTFMIGTPDDAEGEHEGQSTRVTAAPPTAPPPPVPSADAPYTPTPEIGGGVPDTTSPFPWDDGYVAPAALEVEGSPMPLPQPPPAKREYAPSDRTITAGQQRLVIARKISANLTDPELEEILLRLTHQDKIPGVKMDDMDKLLEAIEAFGRHKVGR